MDTKQGNHVLTLANSIIGVSILAMPYCFKQCGIILSIILLVLSSILSRLTCHFLLKSAIKARLRTFENLAYHVFGSFGKLFVEIGLIGFLLGTCIAFIVVMGDLGPQIVAQLAAIDNSNTLRTSILVALAIFCILPLGLLRNVDSLGMVSQATIAFYGCLVLKIMGESAPQLLLGEWINNVEFWRPSGILQCIPIFSMALFCQTQLFEIYQAIPNASLEKMNEVVRSAVNICTCVYIFVGVFGYIAISHLSNFSGNILMNFNPSIMTEIMKIGFVLSVAFSFPLVIFPCRASLYSLLYKPTYSSLHETNVSYIPEGKFRLLTFLIVLISLIIGVLIPNIELVLGLVGSTIGVMICVLFPATCFICMTSKNTNERILAQIMLCVGIVVMVLGTYANLYAIEEMTSAVATTEKPVSKLIEINVVAPEPETKNTVLATLKSIEDLAVNKIEEIKEIRHEPPQPEAPKDDSLEKKPVEVIKVINLTLNETKPQTKKDVIIIKKDEVDSEAIKKEDKELLDQAKENGLEQQKKLVQEQKELVEEHKKILEEIKFRQEKEIEELVKVKEEKMKAVKNIETLARMAIESLVDKPSNEVNLVEKAKEELKVDDKLIKSSANPEPLSYQLGLNDKKRLIVNSKLLNNLAPIPIVLTANLSNNKTEMKLNNASKVAEVVKKVDVKFEKEITTAKQIVETQEVVKEIPKGVVDPVIKQNDESLDNVHRDILSQQDYQRRKRDVEKNCENNQKVPALTRDLKSVPEI